MNVETIDVAVERLIKTVLGRHHNLHTNISNDANFKALKGEIEYLFNIQITENIHNGMDLVKTIRKSDAR